MRSRTLTLLLLFLPIREEGVEVEKEGEEIEEINGDDDIKECNKNFRVNNINNGKGRGKDFDKSEVECYPFHIFGHYCYECRTRLPSYKEE